jgi:hypothetical protein
MGEQFASGIFDLQPKQLANFLNFWKKAVQEQY